MGYARHSTMAGNKLSAKTSYFDEYYFLIVIMVVVIAYWHIVLPLLLMFAGFYVLSNRKSDLDTF